MSTPQQPDVFESMVQKVLVDGSEIHYLSSVVKHRDAITLLRAYHRRVVRLVTRRAKLYQVLGYSASSEHGRRAAYVEILVYLNELKKGTL